MSRAAAVVVALCAVAGAAAAQPVHGVMQVSVTVVNTCFFGMQTRCLRRGTLPRVQVEAQRPASGEVAAGRRIVHF